MPGTAPWLTAAVAIAAAGALLPPLSMPGESTAVVVARAVMFSATGEVDQSFLLQGDGPLFPTIVPIRIGSLPSHALGADADADVPETRR